MRIARGERTEQLLLTLILLAAAATGVAAAGEEAGGKRDREGWLPAVVGEFVNDTAANVLPILAAKNGSVLTVSEDAKHITIKEDFTGVSVRRAFEIIQERYGLTVDLDPATLAIRVWKAGESGKPLLVQLRHRKPEDVVETLAGYEKQGFIKGLKVMADPANNSVLLLGGPDVLDSAKQMIQVLDVPDQANAGKVMIKRIPLSHARVGDSKQRILGTEVTIPGIEATLKKAMAMKVRLVNTDAATPEADLAALAREAAVSGQPGRDYDLFADQRTNSIVLVGTPEKIADLEQVIRQLDVPVPMIGLQAIVVQTNDNLEKELGIDWGGAIVAQQQRKNRVDVAGGLAANNSTLLEPVDEMSSLDRDQTEVFAGSNNNITTDAAMRPLSSTWISGTATTSLVGMFTSDYALLTARLNALDSGGKTKILSKPTVATLDNVEAVIEAGTTHYIRLQGRDEVELSEVHSGVILRVTPHFVPVADSIGSVVLDIFAENSQATSNPVDVVDINKTNAATRLCVPLGQTAVIGGLRQKTQEHNKREVPFLGKIPVMGRLFRTEQTVDRDRTVYIFITPQVVNQDEMNKQAELCRTLESWDPMPARKKKDDRPAAEEAR